MAGLDVISCECVASVEAVLGEGPLWDPRINCLLFLDIKGNKVFQFDPSTRKTRVFESKSMISALGLAEGGGYVCVHRDGFARLFLREDAVRLEQICDPEADIPGNRFNDGKVDAAGGFWAGTMDDGERLVTGSWWRLSRDGECRQIDTDFHITNGPAFDSNRARVYLTDSAARTIFVAGFDGERIENKRVFRQFTDSDGYPDGMEVDREGCLWSAFWDGGVIRRFAPDGGHLQTIKVSAQRPTSISIVANTIYVTSARVGLEPHQLEECPDSGGLFEIRLSQDIGAEQYSSFVGN